MTAATLAVEFTKPPKKLHIRVEDGEIESHCGLVSDDRAQMVLVAIYRDRHQRDSLYRPTIVSYITNVIAKSDEVKAASIAWRFPASDEEHVELLGILAG